MRHHLIASSLELHYFPFVVCSLHHNIEIPRCVSDFSSYGEYGGRVPLFCESRMPFPGFFFRARDSVFDPQFSRSGRGRIFAFSCCSLVVVVLVKGVVLCCFVVRIKFSIVYFYFPTFHCFFNSYGSNKTNITNRIQTFYLIWHNPKYTSIKMTP